MKIEITPYRNFFLSIWQHQVYQCEGTQLIVLQELQAQDKEHQHERLGDCQQNHCNKLLVVSSISYP